MILLWRNSDRVRINMFDNRFITPEEHHKWFEAISSSNKDLYFIFLINDQPCGLISLNQINYKNRNCLWGFYLGDIAVPKGSGTAMGYLGLQTAFHELKLEKVIGEVLSFNNKSIKFHQRLGFQLEGHLKKEVYRNPEFIDVLRFGILKDEWEILKPRIKNDLKGIGWVFNE